MSLIIHEEIINKLNYYIDFDNIDNFYKNKNKSNIEIYELYDNNLMKKCKKTFINLNTY